MPADDYTESPEGTVPVDYRTTAELEDEENVLSQLEASATILQHSTSVQGEVRNFLETHWKDIQYWTDVIQSHMKTVREKKQTD